MYVIKVGGALGAELGPVCDDIHALASAGAPVVVVHGGSAEANELGRQLGRPPRYMTSPTGMRSRYTDAAALDVLTMAMVGRIKPLIAAQLARLGTRAVGLTGIDGMLITAEKTPPVKALLDGRRCVVRDDLSGRITAINTDLLHMLIRAGYTPVISPPVIDPSVGPLNIDADRLATEIAIALQAECLVLLSDVPGLLRDLDNPSSLVRTIPHSALDEHLPLAQGRMRVKLQAAGAALAGGVARVALGDGRRSTPIQAALDGCGTVIEADLLAAEAPS